MGAALMIVQDIGTAQGDEIGHVLARAMFNDPLAAHILPDRDDRARRLPILFGTLARYGALYGKAQAIGSPIGAGAIWLTPGGGDMTPDRIEACGMDRLPALVGAGAMEQFFAVIGQMETVHEQAVDGDHWYLQVIGVDPAAQKSGMGHALLHPVLDQADAGGHACYLETFSGSTVGYYQRLGFAVVAEGRDPVAGLAYWAMQRKPR